MYRYDLRDETATLAFGAALAPLLKAGDVIALYGDLGAGKTTLTRGLLRALCGEVDVPSPTFTLVQTYDGPQFPVWHFDLYRIASPEELTELAWDDTADGVAIVEWPERAGTRLPAWRLDVRLAAATPGRSIVLEPRGEDWQVRLNDDSFRFPHR